MEPAWSFLCQKESLSRHWNPMHLEALRSCHLGWLIGTSQNQLPSIQMGLKHHQTRQLIYRGHPGLTIIETRTVLPTWFRQSKPNKPRGSSGGLFNAAFKFLELFFSSSASCLTNWPSTTPAFLKDSTISARCFPHFDNTSFLGFCSSFAWCWPKHCHGPQTTFPSRKLHFIDFRIRWNTP